VYVVVGCFVMAVAGVFWRVQRGAVDSHVFPRDNSHLFRIGHRHERIEVLWSFACEGFHYQPHATLAEEW
jgi:hypothetical protein